MAADGPAPWLSERAGGSVQIESRRRLYPGPEVLVSVLVYWYILGTSVHAPYIYMIGHASYIYTSKEMHAPTAKACMRRRLGRTA